MPLLLPRISLSLSLSLSLSSASLQPLLVDEFDAKSFATRTIQAQMVGETLSKLAEGISLLDKELYTQVVGNYEDLLSQANGIEALESKTVNVLIVGKFGGILDDDLVLKCAY